LNHFSKAIPGYATRSKSTLSTLQDY